MFGFRQKSGAHKKTQALGPDFVPTTRSVSEPAAEPAKPSRPLWAGLELFADMSGRELEAVGSALERSPFKAGETIIREGDGGDSMFILESGIVRVEMADQNFSTQLQGPTSFGEMALITSEPRSATVIASGDVNCFRLKRAAFESLVKNNVAAAKILTRLVGERLKEIGGIRKVGKYRIVGVLGKGNVADVFEALHPDLNQTVAIKMLSHALVYDPQFGVHFDREAQVVAALNHPNIVRVFDFERAYGTRFTVMERLEGQQLEDFIYNNPRPGWSSIRTIVHELGSALQYSHERGLIHRDVKPSNVYLTNNGPSKLLDFGIAIHMDHSGETGGARLGSPCYMAPEQILGKALDGRTDLYALGITVFELICGEVPFNETQIRALLKRQLHEKTPDVRTLVPDCPEDLAEFIRVATEKSPDKRYKDCAAAVASLSVRRVTTPLSTSNRTRIVLDYAGESSAQVKQLVARFEAQFTELEVYCKVKHQP